MDLQIFVQNVESRCRALGILPTIACRESGVGNSFLSMVKAGSAPSIIKAQKLAEYLGVTTSELLGENVDIIRPNAPIADEISPDFIVKFRSLSPDDQDEVMAIIELKHSKKKKCKDGN